MRFQPTEIKRDGTHGLAITWTDGTIDRLPSEKLRRLCPCAGCREERGDSSHSKPLTATKLKKSPFQIVENTVEESCRLEQVWGVGNYAVGIRWGDGHDDGIYTFSYLKELASESDAPRTVQPEP